MPRKAYTPQKRADKRRQEIVRSALACFVEFGVANTTMEDIRQRSGASNGSIYHHFTNKEMLAAAVYVQGLKEYQAGFVEELARAQNERAGISGIVRFHLHWVKKNPDWARYLQEMRHAEFMAASEQMIAEHNREFMRAVIRWLKPHVEAGTIRRVGLDLFFALVIGPCQEYTRIWLSGQARTELSTAIKEISDAAWPALRGPTAD